MTDALYLHDLVDGDVHCAHIEKTLDATVYYRGRPTPHPDWGVQLPTLKRLMSLFGLLKPHGTKPGPRAGAGLLGGEMLLSAEEAEIAAERRSMDDGIGDDYLRKQKAEVIIFYSRFMGEKLADSYRKAFPGSEANNATAAKEARRLVDWYEARYGQGIEHVLAAHGIGLHTVAAKLKEFLKAQLVRYGRQTDMPAWSVRIQAMRLQRISLGIG